MADIQTKLKWNGDNSSTETSKNGTPIKAVGKSFLEDYKGAWSPVHLLVAAAESCFFATLMSIAEKMRVGIESFELESYGTLGSPDGKHSAVTGITIKPKMVLKNESDRPKLKTLYEKAEEYCTVGNSLNFKVKIEE